MVSGEWGEMFFWAGFFHREVDIVAVNDLTDAGRLVHFPEYDSVQSALDEETSVVEILYVLNPLILRGLI